MINVELLHINKSSHIINTQSVRRQAALKHGEAPPLSANSAGDRRQVSDHKEGGGGEEQWKQI